MTYSNIIALIQAVFLEIVPTGTFVSGTLAEAGVKSVAHAWPLCILLPLRDTTDYDNGQTQPQLTILFLDQDTENNTEAQRDTLINGMSELRHLFMKQLRIKIDGYDATYGTGKYSITGKVLGTAERDRLAGKASGYGISFTLNSTIGC